MIARRLSVKRLQGRLQKMLHIGRIGHIGLAHAGLSRLRRHWRCGLVGALLCLVGLSASADMARAQSSQGIVAVVNNSVISNYDLQQRVGLALVTSGLARTAEIEAALRPQALSRLIDERLKLQEAGRYNVSIREEDLQAALARLAQDNNMTFTDIRDLLEENGVAVESLRTQIIADLAWNRVLEGLFVPRVSLSQDEVEQAYNRARDELSQTQYLVSEIVLQFDNIEQEKDARENALGLLEPLRSGTPFDPVARQFSQSPTSANGGRIGWVVAGQLPEEIDRLLPLLQPGEISDPVRTDGAWHIIQLVDRNEGGRANPLLDRVSLARAFLPLAADADAESLRQADVRVQEFLAEFTDCVEGLLLANSIGAEFEVLDSMLVSQLQPDVQDEILPLGAGDLLSPRRTDAGVEMVAVCGRERHLGASITRVDVERGLLEREVELLGRRHLRDLRRNALIELR